MQAKNGNWIDAGINALGIIPYVGDIPKVGKIGKDVKIIGHAAEDLAKAEKRAAKLSEVGREGKDFTKAGKEATKDLNKVKNEGKMRCESCGQTVENPTKHTKGEKPPGNEDHVDHV